MICLPTCEIENEPLVWVPVWIAGKQDCLPTNDAPEVFADPSSELVPTSSYPLDDLSNLPEDWDGQGAPAPQPNAIEFADRMLAEDDKFGLEPVSTLPSAVGGVGITYVSGTREVFVETRNNGRIYSIRSDRGRQPEFSQVDPANINEFFESVTRYLYSEPLASALEVRFCEAID